MAFGSETFHSRTVPGWPKTTSLLLVAGITSLPGSCGLSNRPRRTSSGVPNLAARSVSRACHRRNHIASCPNTTPQVHKRAIFFTVARNLGQFQ
jgi:hypothetical protein